MDYRFHSAIREFLVSMDLKNRYDVISVAGAAKELVDGTSTALLDQVELSQRLHGITDVYVIHHLDCGAYGGHDAFDGVEAELSRQHEDLSKAAEIITEKFPELKVHKVLARIGKGSDVDNIDFEMIT